MKRITKLSLGVVFVVIVVPGARLFLRNTSTSRAASHVSNSTTITKSSTSKTSSSSTQNSNSSSSESTQVGEAQLGGAFPTEISPSNNEQANDSAQPDVTNTGEQNQASVPAQAGVDGATETSQSGRGSVEVSSGTLEIYQDTPVYAETNKSSEIVYMQPKGSIDWDDYIQENGEFWYSFVSTQGNEETRYYIAYSDVDH